MNTYSMKKKKRRRKHKKVVHLAVAGGVLMASFVLSLFPLDVLDEIWDLLRLSQFLRDFLPTLLLHSQKKKKIRKVLSAEPQSKNFFIYFRDSSVFFPPILCGYK